MGKTIRSIIAGSILAFAIIFFSVGVLAPYLPQDIARPDWRGTVALQDAEATSLAVENGSGTVRIEVWDGPGIRVEADVRFYSPDISGVGPELHAEKAVKGTRDGETYRVVSGLNDAFNLRSDMEIRVPRGTPVRVENLDGLVRVGPGCDAVMIRGLNTDMLVYAPQGAVDLDTVNGRILLLDITKGGRARTENGSILARLRGGSFEAETGNGLVAVSILDPAVEVCDLTSTNGGITLTLAPACRAEVDAATDRGVFVSELEAESPLALAGQPRSWRGILRGTAVPAEGQDALSQLTLRTRNGNISIREGGS